jgi:hypothetical protein
MPSSQTAGYLQTLPQGLMGFMQAKGQGNNPQTLGKELTPTLDLTYWYMATNADIAASTAVAAAVGFVAATGLIVSQGSFRYVDHYTIGSDVLGAGDAILMTPAIQMNVTSGAPLNFAIGPTTFAGTTGDQMFIGADRLPLIVPPDTQFGFFVHRLTGAVQLTATIRQARLTI